MVVRWLVCLLSCQLVWDGQVPTQIVAARHPLVNPVTPMRELVVSPDTPVGDSVTDCPRPIFARPVD
jgi:hypothetical protein